MPQLLAYDSGAQEPHFQKPADVKTASITPDGPSITDGFSITGKVVSYNSANEITYSLYPSDGKGGYSKTALEGHNGATLIAAETANTSGQHTQQFEITGVPAGKYKLVIRKKIHVDFTILGITINGSDVDLTSDTRLTADGTSGKYQIVMGAGDVNGDNRINDTDDGYVTAAENWNMTIDKAETPEANVNGDNNINDTDSSIITSAEFFNTNSVDNYTIKE
jgi:hypothetical protein